jgi:hypothetical protein
MLLFRFHWINISIEKSIIVRVVVPQALIVDSVQGIRFAISQVGAMPEFAQIGDLKWIRGAGPIEPVC